MPRPHLALLDATLGAMHAQRNFKRDLDASLSIFKVSEGELPPPVASEDTVQAGEAAVVHPFDGVVLTGSQSSVYHDEDWIAELSTWMRGAIDAGLPILGVCWGHQLLADVLGGHVKDMGEYELGFIELEQAANDPIFEDVDDPFTVFATHHDHVAEVPDGATLLAENEYGVQGFRKGPVYGVQFHPEYDLRTAEDMISRKDIPARDLQRALDSLTDDNVRAAERAKTLLDNFVRFVQQHGESVEV